MINVTESLEESNLFIINEESYSAHNKDKYITWFEILKNKGAILKDTNFEDKKWRITDTLEQHPLDFTINMFDFQRQKKAMKYNCEISDLENALKAYTLIKLKNYDVDTVKIKIYYILRGFTKTNFFNIEKFKSLRHEQMENPKSETYRNMAESVLDFLDFFEMIEIEDNYYNLLECWLEIETKRIPRVLPTFTSYFKFQDKMTEFMEDLKAYTDAIKSKYPFDLDTLKLKYYPIILWWRITSWLPMRTTEFTVTPYDCIEYKNGKYMLTVMKSTEKGRRADNEKSHNIEDSFAPVIVEVNKDIYDIINEYKSLVDKYDDIEDFYGDRNGVIGRRKYLLSLRGHISCIPEQNRNSTILTINVLDYFTSNNLYRLLKSFYNVVITNTFKLSVYTKGTKKIIGVNEIEKICCMDTRHFSIMNLLMQDVSPIIVKELAGHSTIETTYNYCKHVESYIENYSYFLAQKYAKNDISNSNISVVNLTLTSTSNDRTIYYTRKILSNEIKYNDVENGWCIYDKKDTIECKKNGFECKNGCKYYIPNGYDVNDTITSNKTKIKIAVEVLQELIKNRKQIKDFEVAYKTELSKIKSYAEQNAVVINEYMIKKQ